MYLSYEGMSLPKGALEEKVSRGGGITYAIWWNMVPSVVLNYAEINQILNELDGKKITHKETKQGCYTISRTALLGEGYFIRVDKEDKNKIEVCGILNKGRDRLLIRYKVSQSYVDDFGALDAWIEFKEKVNDFLGKSLSQIFGGLPKEYHQFRTCVPSPINWASSAFTLSPGYISENCVKADICSAYGTEASKTLPDCHLARGKVLDGKHEPTADLPFAFYLKSGHMAIYQEGSTYQLNKSPYITSDHTIFVSDEEEQTLLLPAATENLRDVFENLYEGRKDNPNNKYVMNMTIGMFHRKRWTQEQDNLWPLAAAIKFRCNKRIVDTCEALKQKGQNPILINTDSILWEGNNTEGFDTEKKLGNFVIEYEECYATIRSSKIYQIYDPKTGETLTRWSGSHTKKVTSLLSFGRIWDSDVYEYLRKVEMENTIKWDKKKSRYINKLGEEYADKEELPEWITTLEE